MSRLQAFLVHLGVSLTAFGVIAYVVMTIWYPDFFFYTDGGWQGLRLLLGVDLVLGPMLTLIVYRRGKPGLNFDLTAIGVIQVSCLAIGTWIVHDQRPLAVAYVDGTFYTVTAQSFRELDLPVPNFEKVPGADPKWVTVKLPDSYEEQSVLRAKMLQSGRMLSTLSDRYQPLHEEDIEVIDAQAIEDIVDRDRDVHALDHWVALYGGALSDYQFHTFGGRYAVAYLGFDIKSRRFVGYLPTPAPS